MSIKIILAILFVVLLVGMLSLIPNSPSTAYPPPRTPVPPTYVYPTWFGVYCNWPHMNSSYGLVRIIWWNPDYSIQINPADPGYFYVYYNGTYFDYTFYTVNYIRGSQIELENLWIPHLYNTAEITAYVKDINGTVYPVTPAPYKLYCPPRLLFLPFIRK